VNAEDVIKLLEFFGRQTGYANEKIAAMTDRAISAERECARLRDELKRLDAATNQRFTVGVVKP
jgi:uncharacterized protein YfcZ (UPF0381/DUF406 family)